VRDRKAAQILESVVRLIERDGYDAVELRAVARDARVSLSTIYQHFPSRDALLLATVEQWMQASVYQPLAAPSPTDSLADQLVSILRQVFEPWLDHPRMLEAFIQIREGPGGSQLEVQGYSVVQPLARAAFGEAVDADEFQEVTLVCRHVVYSVMWEYARGRMDADAIIPVLETTVRRLVASTDVSPARGPGRAGGGSC
jgi:AcrR family transcriptional regulator